MSNSPGSQDDRQILRALAREVRTIAELPVMPAKRRLLADLNALRPARPVVLVFPEGGWSEILPESSLLCTTPLHRKWERSLRQTLYQWNDLQDDNIVLPFFDIPWVVDAGDFGVQVPMHFGDRRGSYVWEPPLTNLLQDLPKLRFRQPVVDRQETLRRVDYAHSLFGDLLTPRIRYQPWWTVGMTQTAVFLVGMEQLMLAMYDEPEQVHRLMAFLRDEALHFAQWFEDQGLLTPNDDNTGQCGSGGTVFTDDQPASHAPIAIAKLSDCWGLSESQETTGISPAMFDEFILPYQLPLLQKFKRAYYGCCEPLHARIGSVLRIPNLHNVSVSPWADQKLMAESLGRRFVYCRKPNPAHVSVGFNEPAIREDLRETLRTAGAAGCAIQFVLKDTHTVENQPARLSRWVQIARQEIDAFLDRR